MMTTKRIDYLEGLRGVAALLIVFHHYAESFVPGAFTKNGNDYHLPFNAETLLYSTPLKLPIAGSIWLYVFLILSGMVITYGFLQKNKDISWLKKLCKTRYIRLIGPILAIGVLILGAMKLGFNYNQQAAQISGSWWWLGQQWQFTPSLLGMLWQQGVQIFFQVLPITSAYNSSLWVIPYFFLGAFILAFLLFLGKKIGKWRFLLYAVSAIGLSQTLFMPLILGIPMGEWLHFRRQITSKTKILGLIMLVFGIYLGTYPTFNSPEQIAGSWYALLPRINYGGGYTFYHTLGALLIIAGIASVPLIQRFLSWAGFLFLGKISYAMYVTQILFIMTLASWLLVSWHNLINYNLILLIMVLTCWPLTIGLAYLINKYIERPLGKIKL